MRAEARTPACGLQPACAPCQKLLVCRVSVVCSIPSKSAENAQFGRWAVLYRNLGFGSVRNGGKTAEHLSFGKVLSPCAGRNRDACADPGAGAGGAGGDGQSNLH